MKLSEAYAIVQEKLDAAEVPYRYFYIVVQAHQFRYTRKNVFSKLEYYVKVEVHFEKEQDISGYKEYFTMYLKYFYSFQGLFDHLDKIAGKIQGADTVEV